MPLIEIQRFPGTPKERDEVPSGTFFYAWLSQQNLHQDICIRVNGVDLRDDDELNFELKEKDHVVIFDQPKGVIGDILSPIFKVVGQVFSFLMPKPSIPNAAGAAEESPNNSLTGQTNTARLYKAKPDIYGQVRSYPDLIQESMFEYIDNLKYVTEFMCVGIGKYSRSSVRYSESSLGAMAGASYQFFDPGEVIPIIYEGYSFDDVDGQELPGPNESGDFPIETATADVVVSGVYGAGQIVMKINKQDEFDYFYDLVRPHSVTFEINVSYNTASGPETRDISVTANMFNAEISDDGSLIDPQEYYSFFFNNLRGSDISGLPADVVINTTKFILNDNEALIVGPVFSPIESTELWIHLQAQLGDGDYARTDVTWWKVDDDNNQIPGTTEGTNIGLNNDDGISKTKFGTFKFTPAAGNGRYAVSFRRSNNSNDHSILKVEEIHAVNPRVNVVHPTDTLVKVTVRATQNALGSRDRKYNLMATRHTISYNLDTRTVEYTLRPSRSFADAVVHTWLVMGEQDASSIDLYQLYSIAEALPDERLGYFDYTFDNENDSLGDRIQAICSAASVIAYWDSGVLTFTRDQKVDHPAAVFNRSNMLTEGYKVSYEATLPGGFDGVQVAYVHPTTNNKTYINYRILDNTIVEQEAANPSKFDVVGFRNEYQARERALRETKRLLYSRVKMTAKVFEDGIIQVGSVIQMPDIYDTNQQQGYIVGRNGNNFDTSEPITFAGDMYVVVTDSIGNPTYRYPATARVDTVRGFTAAIPEIALNIWDGGDVQSPSRYLIATSEELDSALWTVNSLDPNSDGTVSLTLSEYSDLIYI